MEIQLRELEPGARYAVQVRSTAEGRTPSEWSPRFLFITGTDTGKPAAPGNLAAVASGTSFIITYNKPTLNEDGSALQDFKEFEISITANFLTKKYTTTA